MEERAVVGRVRGVRGRAVRVALLVRGVLLRPVALAVLLFRHPGQRVQGHRHRLVQFPRFVVRWQ